MRLSPKSNYEKNFVPCFDIGEVPRILGKRNWNWLYFLPFIFFFEQCDWHLHSNDSFADAPSERILNPCVEEAQPAVKVVGWWLGLVCLVVVLCHLFSTLGRPMFVLQVHISSGSWEADLVQLHYNGKNALVGMDFVS